MNHQNSIFVSRADFELQFIDLFPDVNTPASYVVEITLGNRGELLLKFWDPDLIQRPSACPDDIYIVPPGLYPLLLRAIMRKPTQIAFFDNLDRNFVLMGAAVSRKLKAARCTSRIRDLESRLLDAEQQHTKDESDMIQSKLF